MRHPLNSPIGRFGIDTLDLSDERCVSSIAVHGMTNPLTGAPTLAALTVLVDHACGLVNHHRREPDEWTVSTELALELSPEAEATIAARPGVRVVATARPTGEKGDTALGRCRLSHGSTVIGVGTVRSVHLHSPGVAESAGSMTADPADYPATDISPRSGLADMMAVTAGPDGEPTLLQHPDPVLNNTLGIVHGGIASAGLELVASAALNAGRSDPLSTASVRVNFLRQFFAGDQSRYTATVLRAGRRSGVADAQAVGNDGKVALIARVTAYR
ncbi:PaaI family thioesterase [Mycobacterium sp. OTB74]|jgi:uncharacterized protein (TIGR00369 family)|uniref:PaaI family thioesterase n=1 Tax=Mycobacterium sp. OTB74 TaxID=1853452 RepID=UPI00247353BD|nr:PaaI family thioesterase [Mycobacterium sp. OTB74]MDH6245378.1 uncharacterized protein (TIGR00369 family) [Mycobacterium sp. OTB74]